MKYLCITYLLMLTLNINGQVDFNRKKIRLEPIDTSEVFIYETKNALLFFSQHDLIEYFSKSDKRDRVFYQDFIDTLRTNKNTIHIISDSIYDKDYKFNKAYELIDVGESPSGKDKRDYLSLSFMFVASDFILSGKVKPYLKAEKKYITDFIIAKTEDGYLGSEFLVFYSPKRIELFEIIITFGE